MSEPRVWIGTLGLYNAGHLIGAWFDAIDCPTDVEEWKAHDSISPQLLLLDIFALAHEVGEEVWCFDHENFGGLIKGECSPMTAQQIGQLIEDAGGHGLTAEHLKSYVDFTNSDIDKIDEMQVADAWIGEVEKPWHYVFDYVQETYPALHDDGNFKSLPHEVIGTIDWEAVTEAYEANGTLGVYFDEIAHNRTFVWRSE